jgi:hypothetical protein
MMLVLTSAGPGLIGGFLFFGSPAQASATPRLSFIVSTSKDAHDAHPRKGKCADSAGKCTLRAAIEVSNAAPAGTITTVTVPAGTYKLTLGLLPVTRNTVVVNGAGSQATVIKAPVSAAHQLIDVAKGATATFSRLKLTDGTASAASGGALTNSGTTTLRTVTVTGNTSAAGGGLTNAAGATLRLVASTVSDNMASQGRTSGRGGSGGGILNAGKLTLSRSTVSGNYAGEGGFGSTDPAGRGGNGGGIASTGTVVASSSTISGNYAGSGGVGLEGNEPSGPGGDGGGIYSSEGSVTLTDTVVSGNFAGFAGPAGEGTVNAGDGGGVWSSATLIVTGATFTSNSGGGSGISPASRLGGSGGGIFTSGTASVSSSTFAGNTGGTGGSAGGNGGAIASTGTLTLTNSTLSGDSGGAGAGGGTGGNGGGLYAGAGTATVTGDTFDSDTSGTGGDAIPVDPGCAKPGPGGDGGALYSLGALSVTDSTLSGNTVGAGGAYQRPCAGNAPSGIGSALATGAGSTTVAYSTIAGNTDGIVVAGGTVTLGGTIVADSNAGPNCSGTVTETSGYNLDSGTSCGFSLSSDIVGTEPSLGPLASNGGPTQTRALRPGSPAIDHGGTRASGCPAADQRGKARPDEPADSGACDIGAYESQGLS